MTVDPRLIRSPSNFYTFLRSLCLHISSKNYVSTAVTQWRVNSDIVGKSFRNEKKQDCLSPIIIDLLMYCVGFLQYKLEGNAI